MSEPSSVSGAGSQTDATLADVTVKVEHRAATPIAGAIAGILFAVLFAASIMTITTTMADVAHDTGAWLELGRDGSGSRSASCPSRASSSSGSSPLLASAWAGLRISSSRRSSSAAAFCSWR